MYYQLGRYGHVALDTWHISVSLRDESAVRRQGLSVRHAVRTCGVMLTPAVALGATRESPSENSVKHRFPFVRLHERRAISQTLEQLTSHVPDAHEAPTTTYALETER